MPRCISFHCFRSLLSKRLCTGILFLCPVLLAACGGAACAQEPVNDLPDAPEPQSAGAAPPATKVEDAVTLRKMPVDILHEQAAIWTSPVRIRDRDLKYLVPLALVTAVLFTTDHQVMSGSWVQHPGLNSDADTASTGLVGGFVAVPVLLYGLGHIHQDDHATETGILGGEAMVDALIVGEVVKDVTMRERPMLDGAQGNFFQSSVGLNSSFPSVHCIIAWSSAAVIASEYTGPMTQIAAYGLASGVTITRVLARQHFPSDVVVGSALGWMIGRYVHHKHHKVVIQ